MAVYFTRRQWMVIGALLVAVMLHVGSMCVFVRHYARSFVFEFGEGFATIYWGGGEEFRNSCVYNAGEWPLRPETHFAGGYLAEGQRWEAYGPSLILHRQLFPDRVQHQGVVRAFGYGLPKLRRERGAASVLLPLGSIALLVELGALIFARGWRPNHTLEATAYRAPLRLLVRLGLFRLPMRLTSQGCASALIR